MIMVTPYRRKRKSVRRPYRRRRSTYSRRPTRRRSTYSRRGKAMSCSVLTPSAKFAMAQLDPFDPSVAGAKIPDSNTMPSISTSDIDILSVVGGAAPSDLVGWAFRPQYTWGVVQTTGLPLNWGATYAANSTNRSKRTSYDAAIELTRPVAHAVRLSCPLAPTQASGFVHMALATETNWGSSLWQFPNTVAQMSGCQHYKRVTLASLTQSPITIINKWLDDTGFRYTSPVADMSIATASGIQTDYGWGVIIIVVEGAPTSGNVVLSAEHLLISEGIPQKTGVIIGTVAASNSPGTLGAVGTMSTEQAPFHTEAEQDSYISRGVEALARGAAAAGEQVFENVAVPLLQRAGGIGASAAASYAYNAIAGLGGIPGVNANPGRLALNR